MTQLSNETRSRRSDGRSIYKHIRSIDTDDTMERES